MAERRQGIRWLALILSFVGAAFVGLALALGAAFIAIAVSTVFISDFVLVDTAGTALAVAGSGVLFLGTWWVFYGLVKRSLE